MLWKTHQLLGDSTISISNHPHKRNTWMARFKDPPLDLQANILKKSETQITLQNN